jgi:hypothetical protein
MQTLGSSTDQKKTKICFFFQTKMKKQNVSFTKKWNVDIPSLQFLNYLNSTIAFLQFFRRGDSWCKMGSADLPEPATEH